MWTIAAVNKKFDGPLGSYNGLTDVHLAHYFSRPSQRSHLKTAKLITDDGFIVPEKNVKVKLYLDEKKKKIYDILARSILQNAIHKEGSWNKKLCNYLEDISKMAAVDKARKTLKKKSNKVSSELFFQQPISSSFSFEDGLSKGTKKQLYNSKTIKPSTAPVACYCFSNDRPHKVANLKTSLSAKLCSPYGIPVLLSGSYKDQFQAILDYEKPTRHKKRKHRKNSNSIGQKKKNLTDNEFINVPICQQTLKFNHCQITMLYHGHLHLAGLQKTLTQDIVIKQQHCGGTPVMLYKGGIGANELLSFYLLDHEGFFFSITVFLNGIRELKLSSCCVFRYIPGKRLGGSNGTFSIKKIEGGKPCLKCQYQEFENSNFKLISQSSGVSLKNIKNKGNSELAASVDLNHESKSYGKTSDILSEADESDRVNDISIIPDFESSKIVYSDESVEDVIKEELNLLPNENAIENVLVDEDIPDETNDTSYEEEDKESYEEEIKEKEESQGSSNQSEISEDFVEEPKNYREILIGSSSSEDEGENKHVVSVSVHETPENNKQDFYDAKLKDRSRIKWDQVFFVILFCKTEVGGQDKQNCFNFISVRRGNTQLIYIFMLLMYSSLDKKHPDQFFFIMS